MYFQLWVLDVRQVRVAWQRRISSATHLLDEPPIHENGQLFLGLPLLLHHVLLYLHPRGDLQNGPQTKLAITSRRMPVGAWKAYI